MNTAKYQAGGPLLANSSIYITRLADKQASAHLQRMEYITLVEPRQHGKTSLINHLIAQFTPLGYVFAVRDMMAAKTSAGSAETWYRMLGTWLMRQMQFIETKDRPELPVDSSSWESFLAEIAERAQLANYNVVIVLDEIGALPSSWATEFFSVIRSLYTSRQNLSFWQHITFIISGAFNPKELIQDQSVSNFNVDQRIILQDFTMTQVEQLVSFLGLTNELCNLVAKRIYHWTSGQPYLCQRLCLYLVDKIEEITEEAHVKIIDEAVKQFFLEDTNHLSRIKDLTREPELLAYLNRITGPSPSRFNASLNDRHFRLAHIIGIIKANPEGYCQIRNPIYSDAILEIELSNDSNQRKEKSEGENIMLDIPPDVQAKGIALLVEIGRMAVSELKERWILANKEKSSGKSAVDVDLSEPKEDIQKNLSVLICKSAQERGTAEVEHTLSLIERKRDIISEWKENKVDNEEEYNRQTITRATLRLRQEELDRKIIQTMTEIANELSEIGIEVITTARES